MTYNPNDRAAYDAYDAWRATQAQLRRMERDELADTFAGYIENELTQLVEEARQALASRAAPPIIPRAPRARPGVRPRKFPQVAS
ncbi:MAG: hypothetical protein JWO67_4075 [Streptosporangiaceae bacterium]|nr:hypothetical protein [Streptosporangiaceae bacterium]